MMEEPNQIVELLNKPVWTTDEEQQILRYLENTGTSELKAALRQRFDEYNQAPIDRNVSHRILTAIHEKIGIAGSDKKKPVITAWFFRMAVAACIGLLILFAYLWQGEGRKSAPARTIVTTIAPEKDVPPGGNKAVLTLADGSTLMLDDAHNGTLTRQGNTIVSKLGGKLTYHNNRADIKEVLYNTISTPRGGQYQIKLPDGSQVWLNALSSLRFPTAFTGAERKVEITGEAYFEVAPDKTLPFVVAVSNAEIRVIGTHFNVMAYTDETFMKTSLLEGSVKFMKGNSVNTLRPGQQSRLSRNGHVTVINNVDIEAVTAWKNGSFYFNGEDIGTVTRQLSRWYDVEVTYTKESDDLFYAEIPRNTSLSDALKALALTGKVRFEIDGRRIKVIE